MTRIVTTHHRYKRPPRKRKAPAVAIEAPAIVTASGKWPRTEHTKPVTPAPANDDGKSAIVTIPSRKHTKRARALKAAEAPDRDPEAEARVKAFFARMVRPSGPLPPKP